MRGGVSDAVYLYIHPVTRMSSRGTVYIVSDGAEQSKPLKPVSLSLKETGKWHQVPFTHYLAANLSELWQCCDHFPVLQ